jgi:hypothetical protein
MALMASDCQECLIPLANAGGHNNPATLTHQGPHLFAEYNQWHIGGKQCLEAEYSRHWTEKPIK